MGRSPPKTGLRPVPLGTYALQNFPGAHIKKLHIGFGVLLPVTRDEVAQLGLPVWRVDEKLASLQTTVAFTRTEQSAQAGDG
jgi:hypothetical protein